MLQPASWLLVHLGVFSPATSWLWASRGGRDRFNTILMAAQKHYPDRSSYSSEAEGSSSKGCPRGPSAERHSRKSASVSLRVGPSRSRRVPRESLDPPENLPKEGPGQM